MNQQEQATSNLLPLPIIAYNGLSWQFIDNLKLSLTSVKPKNVKDKNVKDKKLSQISPPTRKQNLMMSILLLIAFAYGLDTLGKSYPT